jgi:hypothetical protein
MYEAVGGIGCECGETATVAVDEDDGVSFYCVMCDRRVGRLEN